MSRYSAGQEVIVIDDSRKDTFGRQLRELSADILQPGDIFDGHYRILSVLGRGGMGVVYKAEHFQAPALLYAVKTLRPHESYGQALREATTMAALRHRNIVRVMDVGTTTDNTSFLAMEYVGPDLGEYLKKCGGTLPPHTAVEFCAQVCDALEVAHGQRIVHRDIKPGNCLVRNENGTNYIVVCDFGLARVLHDEDSRSSDWTMAGSSGYMAPEIFTGQFRPDHRVDIYSVGVMFFCLLTGSPPVNPFSSDKETREYLDAVPRVFLSILRKAVAIDPGQRFYSARALGTALRYASALSFPVPGASSPPRPERSPRAKLAIGTLCLAAVTVAMFFTNQFWGEAEAPSPPAPLATQFIPEPADSPVAATPRVISENNPSPAALPEAAAIRPPIDPTANNPPKVSKATTKSSRPPAARKASALQEALPKTGLMAIDETKTIINNICAKIAKDCAGVSAEKQRSKYKAPGSLAARLRLRPQSAVGAQFTDWGIMKNDDKFKACARLILKVELGVHPIKSDAGSRPCTVTM